MYAHHLLLNGFCHNAIDTYQYIWEMKGLTVECNVDLGLILKLKQRLFRLQLNIVIKHKYNYNIMYD